MHTYMCILDLSCWSLNRDLKLNCLYNELVLHVLKHYLVDCVLNLGDNELVLHVLKHYLVDCVLNLGKDIGSS
jgi:hypothetical protein